MTETMTNGSLQTYVGTRTTRPDGADKVTGRARFGADFNLPGQLIGRVLRSPHPHARIVSIDTSKAEALPGVKAVITRADFADQSSEFIPAGEMMMNYKDVVRNVMAREKALYELMCDPVALAQLPPRIQSSSSSHLHSTSPRTATAAPASRVPRFAI